LRFGNSHTLGCTRCGFLGDLYLARTLGDTLVADEDEDFGFDFAFVFNCILRVNLGLVAFDLLLPLELLDFGFLDTFNVTLLVFLTGISRCSFIKYLYI
jgi:hypothetical protein